MKTYIIGFTIVSSLIILISFAIYSAYTIGYNQCMAEYDSKYVIGKGTMVTYDLGTNTIHLEIAEKADPNTIDIINIYNKGEELRKFMIFTPYYGMPDPMFDRFDDPIIDSDTS